MRQKDIEKQKDSETIIDKSTYPFRHLPVFAAAPLLPLAFTAAVLAVSPALGSAVIRAPDFTVVPPFLAAAPTIPAAALAGRRRVHDHLNIK